MKINDDYFVTLRQTKKKDITTYWIISATKCRRWPPNWVRERLPVACRHIAERTMHGQEDQSGDTRIVQTLPSAKEMAEATSDEIFRYVKSVSTPTRKPSIWWTCRRCWWRISRQRADNTEDLTKLPGVGRKTANVIQAVWYGKATMAVDTHVFRVSHHTWDWYRRRRTRHTRWNRNCWRTSPSTMCPMPTIGCSCMADMFTSRMPHCEECIQDICPKLLDHSKLE